MKNHTLELTPSEARALSVAAFAWLKGSTPVNCDDETRRTLSGKMSKLLAVALNDL